MKTVIRSSRICMWLLMIVLSPLASAQVIPVSNLEELYEAVNNPNNVGATVALAEGVYMLSATTPAGAARPKGGRIELQKDMSLIGVEGDRNLVVINAFNLPAASF